MYTISYKNKIVNFGVLAVLISALSLMIYSSCKESATMDEMAHIPSGYSYMKLADYRLNPEHPPLLKDLSAIPLLFLNLNFPKNDPSFQELINGQWITGAKFLYESGNDADTIIFWARFLPILLTLLLSLFVFKWAKELLGAKWGFFVFLLFALNPTVLAHGHYVTTDIAATFGFVAAMYYFFKFLKEPSRKNVIFAGIFFGIAQLLKFSAILLIPYFIIIFAAFLIKKYFISPSSSPPQRGGGLRCISPSSPPPQRGGGLRRGCDFSFTNYIAGFVFLFIIGFLLVYIPYLHHTWNYPIQRQTEDTEFILASFAGGPDTEMTSCKQWVGLSRQIRCLADIDIWMTGNKILRPYAQYLLGLLMVIQRSSGGNTTYFLGEVSAGGWWYYFPVVFVLKEPIPSLILLGLAILACLFKTTKSLILKLKQKSLKAIFSGADAENSPRNFELGALLFFVIFYWVYSMKSPLNIGVRHILPTLPFIYILTIAQIKNWLLPATAQTEGIFKKLFILLKQSAFLIFKTAIIFSLILWYILETFFTSPHFLSYFNEFAGGPLGGYKYTVDSNFDWGQDLKELKKWVEKNNIDKIGIYYFGGGNPQYYFGDKIEWRWPDLGTPKGWFAFSGTFLQGTCGKPEPSFVAKIQNEIQKKSAELNIITPPESINLIINGSSFEPQRALNYFEKLSQQALQKTDRQITPEDVMSYLKKNTFYELCFKAPTTRAGTSIFIYDL